MNKLKIKKFMRDENIVFYKIEKTPEIHKILSEMFFEIGLDDKNIEKVDLPFEEIKDEFIFLKNKQKEIYIFVTENEINIVFRTETKKDREDIERKIGNFLEF